MRIKVSHLRCSLFWFKCWPSDALDPFQLHSAIVLIDLRLGVVMFLIIWHGDSPKQKNCKSQICISRERDVAHNLHTTHNKVNDKHSVRMNLPISLNLKPYNDMNFTNVCEWKILFDLHRYFENDIKIHPQSLDVSSMGRVSQIFNQDNFKIANVW
jgi:hypothetical protein